MPDQNGNVGLLALPNEILAVIASHLTLQSLLFGLSRTSKALRSVCVNDASAWIKPLMISLRNSSSSTIDAAPRSMTAWQEDAELQCLNLAFASWLVPRRALASVLPFVSRRKLLYDLETPRLSNALWIEVCEHRFQASLLGAARRDSTTLEQEQDQVAVRDRRAWLTNPRAFFLKTLQHFEHRFETGCTTTEHTLKYLFIHRSYGLTRNRFAAREYRPEDIMTALKHENAMSRLQTVLIPFSSTFVPIDIEVIALVIRGRDSWLRNETAMQMLEVLSTFHRADWQGDAILGPVLLTARVRASTAGQEERIGPACWCSLDLEDLFQTTAAVGLTADWWRKKLEEKDGIGYR